LLRSSKLFFAGFAVAEGVFHRGHDIGHGDDENRFTAQKQFVADGGGKVVFSGAGLPLKMKLAILPSNSSTY
jgi:chromosome condensin MukBEF MukE localization factor